MTKTKFRPRRERRVSEVDAASFEAKYSDGTNDSISTPKAATPGRAPGKPRKTRATFYLPVELLESLKDAVVALRAAPRRYTMTGVVEEALRVELARLADEHNDGTPFPEREMEPHVGRPPK
ncbi:MAG: hypothetical protein KC619_19985 [Myxococcales bacterium]|nr:hypothetical protein [Myxococcales bacterium]